MSTGFYCVKCIVCGKEDQYGNRLRFFRFPRETERCRSWLRVIGKKSLIYMSLSELYEQSVCEAHFPQQCFSEKGNRMHKVALPTMFTSRPPLPASLMHNWPPKYNASQGHRMQQYNANISQDISLDTLPVINYDRPLMTCMETLINNKPDYIQKPAGVPNTISVPLLQYCNSLEKGTVFAPEEPENLFDLPAIIIEKVDIESKCAQNSTSSNSSTKDSVLSKKLHVKSVDVVDIAQPYTTIKQYTKSKVSTHKKAVVTPYKAIKKYATKSSTATDNGPSNRNTGTLHQYKTTNTNAIQSACPNASDITLRPLTGSINQGLKATTLKKPFVVSFGLNTIITAKKNKGGLARPTVTTNNDSDLVVNPNSVQANMDSETNDGTPGLNTVSMEHGQTPMDAATINTKDLVMPDTMENVTPTLGYGYTNTADVKFVPYSEHIPTVSPESPHAHISDGNMDYGLPLLNCVATIMQSKIHYSNKKEDTDSDDSTIDVPLLTCMKTLKYTTII